MSALEALKKKIVHALGGSERIVEETEGYLALNLNCLDTKKYRPVLEILSGNWLKRENDLVYVFTKNHADQDVFYFAYFLDPYFKILLVKALSSADKISRNIRFVGNCLLDFEVESIKSVLTLINLPYALSMTFLKFVDYDENKCVKVDLKERKIIKHSEDTSLVLFEHDSLKVVFDTNTSFKSSLGLVDLQVKYEDKWVSLRKYFSSRMFAGEFFKSMLSCSSENVELSKQLRRIFRICKHFLDEINYTPGLKEMFDLGIKCVSLVITLEDGRRLMMDVGFQKDDARIVLRNVDRDTARRIAELACEIVTENMVERF